MTKEQFITKYIMGQQMSKQRLLELLSIAYKIERQNVLREMRA